MKSSWISKVLILLVIPWLLFAQEPETRPEKAPDEALKAKAHFLGAQLTSVIKLLRAFRPWEARELLEDSVLPGDLKNLLMGWSYHQEGKYTQATGFFDKVNKEKLGDDYFANRLDELANTGRALEGFRVYETENFSFRYQEGPDKVMLNFLPDIMEEIYDRYSKLFHYKRDAKIIVELMPDHQLFSYASALTREQIETTGTIALCVENRLVMITPRRVLQGYYWPDVIAHEFVHYILTKQSSDHVPLWMQEGVAKFFEARWEQDSVNPIDPGMESSLALAIEGDSLLTVDQMMPSFAALPTAALAQQAYAQTTAMIDYLCEIRSEDIVHRIVTGLNDTPDLNEVMKKNLDMDFQTFETSWREWLKGQGYQKHGHTREMGVSLLDSDGSAEKIDDVQVKDDSMRKHIRLGDLLLERNRYQAALKQYLKTSENGQKPGRQIVLRMIRCYNNLQKPKDILELIDNHVLDLDHDVTMLVYRAQAYMASGDLVRAEPLLRRAIRINPFNPEIFHTLMVLEQENGTEAGAVQAKEILEMLTAPRKAPDKEKS